MVRRTFLSHLMNFMKSNVFHRNQWKYIFLEIYCDFYNLSQIAILVFGEEKYEMKLSHSKKIIEIDLLFSWWIPKLSQTKINLNFEFGFSSKNISFSYVSAGLESHAVIQFYQSLMSLENEFISPYKKDI